jgi:uncharacterized membrane protein YedE/YeeE
MAFFVGILSVPFAMYSANKGVIKVDSSYNYNTFDSETLAMQNLDAWGWVISGLLVGFGSRMAKGCTSHIFVGVPKFQKRSLLASAIMLVCAVSFATIRHFHPFFVNGYTFNEDAQKGFQIGTAVVFGLLAAVVIMILSIAAHARNAAWFWQNMTQYFFGVIFGLGLLFAGAFRPSKVFRAITVDKAVWDPSLIIMTVVALLINFLAFHYIGEGRSPVYASGFEKHHEGPIDLRLIFGSIFFGVGWGMAGLSVITGVMNFFTLTHAVFWLAAVLFAQTLYEEVYKRVHKEEEKGVHEALL